MEQKFYEISEEEQLNTEGGVLIEYAIMLGIVTLIAAAGYDLCNTYNNGYNDVKSTTPPNPNNVSVSCGDSVY